MADRIVVLESGRVVEEGTHAALALNGGVYAELFEMQAAGYGKEGMAGSRAGSGVWGQVEHAEAGSSAAVALFSRYTWRPPTPPFRPQRRVCK